MSLRLDQLDHLDVSALRIRRRRRGQPPHVYLARMIAIGLDLDFDGDLEPGSRAELCEIARAVIRIVGSAPRPDEPSDKDLGLA